MFNQKNPGAPQPYQAQPVQSQTFVQQGQNVPPAQNVPPVRNASPAATTAAGNSMGSSEDEAARIRRYREMLESVYSNAANDKDVILFAYYLFKTEIVFLEEQSSVMISDDIFTDCFFHVSANSVKMIKAFIVFCRNRVFENRKKTLKSGIRRAFVMMPGLAMRTVINFPDLSSYILQTYIQKTFFTLHILTRLAFRILFMTDADFAAGKTLKNIISVRSRYVVQ